MEEKIGRQNKVVLCMLFHTKWYCLSQELSCVMKASTLGVISTVYTNQYICQDV